MYLGHKNSPLWLTLQITQGSEDWLEASESGVTLSARFRHMADGSALGAHGGSWMRGSNGTQEEPGTGVVGANQTEVMLLERRRPRQLAVREQGREGQPRARRDQSHPQ